MAARCPDPVLSRLNPVRHVGAIPELLADKVTQFTDCDPRFYDDVDDTNMDRWVHRTHAQPSVVILRPHLYFDKSIILTVFVYAV